MDRLTASSTRQREGPKWDVKDSPGAFHNYNRGYIYSDIFMKRMELISKLGIM